MADRQYRFPVTSASVVDGDTYWAVVDVGFRITTSIEIRLDGWDCPEKRSSATRKVGPRERAAAKAAHDLSAAWLARHLGEDAVWVETQPDPEKYGRWLGQVTALSGADDLGTALHAADLATPWPTRWWQTHPE